MDLYRFYDHDGTLLYVGISLSAAKRAAEHRAEKQWWPDVDRMDVLHLGDISRATAEAIEATVIRAERPLWNVMHGTYTEPSILMDKRSMTWMCEVCHLPIDDRQGSVRFRLRWHPAHYDCAVGDHAIAIDVAALHNPFDIISVAFLVARSNPELLVTLRPFIVDAFIRGYC